MKFYRTPLLVRKMLSRFTWRVPVTGKTIYLTFDDGPIPEVTPFVLDTLKKYNAKATFFMVGDNVQRHPEIAEQVKRAGHTIGNHTYNHLSGWRNSESVYLQNTYKCQQALEPFLEPGKPNLLRPPYGQIKIGQAAKLSKDYQIIMWDVLSYDFDKNLLSDICLQQTIAATRPGSIVLFHDSLKARRNLEFALPLYLQHFSEQGYTFASL
jgi:peptidoglycan-N-acetylglucosamine deacetylase